MEKKLPELSSEDCKQKLEAGEEIKGYHIERLSLARKKEIAYPINIVECTIGNFDINHSNCLAEVSLRRCDVGTLILSDARFMKSFSFKKCKVGRGRIQRGKFQERANFELSEFVYTSFHESVFEGETDFSRSNFSPGAHYGEATFSGVVFKQDAKFIFVQFGGKGVFKGTQWHGKADFKNTEVGNDLDFRDATFYGDLLLNGTVVRLSIDFNGATMEGMTDFSNANAGRSIILKNNKLGAQQGFRFSNCSSPSILLNRDLVEGHVYPENEGRYLQASREYGFLRVVFQNINRFDDEDWAYYQFKRTERKGQPFSYNPLQLLKRGVEYFFLDLGCGYGTKPFRTLGLSALLVILFAACYFLYFGNAAPPESYGLPTKFLNRICYAFNVSLIAFCSYGDLRITGPIKLLGMLEYMIGVVLLGLFIVAFSRKVIR